MTLGHLFSPHGMLKWHGDLGLTADQRFTLHELDLGDMMRVPGSDHPET